MAYMAVQQRTPSDVPNVSLTADARVHCRAALQYAAVDVLHATPVRRTLSPGAKPYYWYCYYALLGDKVMCWAIAQRNNLNKIALGDFIVAEAQRLERPRIGRQQLARVRACCSI